MEVSRPLPHANLLFPLVRRPQQMELFKLTTPKDDAWRVIETLGHENLCQFLNMNLGVEVTKLLY